MNRITLLIIATLLGAIVYHSALIEVISSILNREGSSHGFFIPIFSALFLWSRRDELATAEKKVEPVYIPLSAALLIIPPVLLPSLRLEFIFFVLYLASLVPVFYGKSVFKISAFSVLFLAVMTPMTGELYVQIGEIARFLTFHISVGILSVLGITHYAEGWFVHLPTAVLEVNLGCSGIRYLISYFVFGIAYAYLSREKPGARVLFVALTVPFSILATSFRLLAIYLLTYFISPKMAEHVPHLITSWTVFGVFLIGGIALDQMTTKFWNKRKLAQVET